MAGTPNDTDAAEEASPRRSWVSADASTAVAVVVVLTLLNAWWLVTNRADGPFDIDEAGYLTQATAATVDIQSGAVLHGPGALWAGSASGPLLPLLTVPVQLVLGRDPVAGLLANLAFFVLLGGATWVLARRWLDRRWALLALVVTLTSPGVTGFARGYVFALAATATFTLALAALVRSERFASRGWAVTFGVAVGLTVLARTIMIAFVPGLVLAGLVAWWQNAPTLRRGRVGNAGLAAGAALVTSASWYVFSARAVLDYLLNFGYGDASADYGAVSVQTAQFWLSDLANLIGRDLFVPLAVLLALGSIGGAWSWWQSARPHAAGRVVRSDAFLVALPVAAGLAALLTSRNTGYGFTLPLVPGAIVLATSLTAHIAVTHVRGILAGALGVVAAVNLAMTSSLMPALGDHRVAWSNGWTALSITDGRSNIARYVEDETPYPLDEGGTVAARQEGWLGAARATRDALRAAGARPGSTRSVIAIDGPLYNLNTLALVGEVDGEDRLRLTAFDAGAAPVTEAAVTAALKDEVDRRSTTLVTGPEALAWDGTGVRAATVETGAEAAGFTRRGEVSLPDGQTVTIWSAPDRDGS